MIVLARFRAWLILVSALFFFRNFASATFLIERLSTAASRSLASSKSAWSYTGGGAHELPLVLKKPLGQILVVVTRVLVVRVVNDAILLRFG